MSKNIQLVKLGQLLNITTGKLDVNASSENGIYPFFTCAEKIYKINTYAFDDEAVLVAGNGDLNVKYYNGKFNAYQRTYVLTAKNNEIDIKYLYFFMQTYIQKLRDKSIGGVIKYIKLGNLTDAKIPFLQLKDQQKIAQLLTQIEDLINKREKSITLLDKLIKSTFLDMFESILTNKKPENLLSFEQMAVIDTNMTTDFEKYANFPHIGIASIEKYTGKILDYKLVKDDNLISGKYIFDERHILYSKIRPNLNKVALPNFKGLLSADGYPILPKDNMNRIFLAHLLRTNFFLNYILGHCDRANIPKVNQKQLSGFSCNIPDKVLQDKFAEIVTQVEQTKTFYQNSLTELNNLFCSIAQKAFKGENAKKKIEKMKTYGSAEDRLKSIEKEFISKMDNKSEIDLKTEDKKKAIALTLGYKFGFYDDESIKLIDDFLDSEEFLVGDKNENELINKILEAHPQPNVFASIIKDDQLKEDEVKIIKNIVNKHSDKNILINGLINIIYEKEQNLRVRYASSELIADYDNLGEEVRNKIIEIIYNEEKIEEEVRLHTAYVFTDKINIYPELYDAIYWILRMQSTSLLGNKEVFIHFLEKEFKEKKEKLAFDTIVKNIAYDSRKMTAYKMFLFGLLKYDLDNELLDNYDYKALKNDIFRLIKEEKIIQKLNQSTYEINLFWNFSELEEK